MEATPTRLPRLAEAEGEGQQGMREMTRRRPLRKQTATAMLTERSSLGATRRSVPLRTPCSWQRL